MKALPRPLASAVSLTDIARHSGLTAHADARVSGIVSDNRLVRPRDIFAALPGKNTHGARFIEDALERGACAILTDNEGAEKLPQGVPYILADKPAAVLGSIASFIYGNPADQLSTYALTGTNGKTTTTFMLEHIFRSCGQSTALIGTIEMRFGTQTIPSVLTTPQPADFQGLLAHFVAQGAQNLVMEVSSHALTQKRTDPVRFSVSGFTNLTHDHLDFHETFEEYFAAKASLFTPEKTEKAVICVDDEWGRRLYEYARENLGASHVWALAVFSTLDENMDGWQVRDIEYTDTTSHFTVTSTFGQTIHSSTRLLGSFNIANAALALVMALDGGVTAQEIEGISGGISPQVPGRMEVISDKPRVIVDFAHNPDALVQALTTLRETTRGRLITLTGAAGERDKEKRPTMGEVVARYSDEVIITDDDPHEEDPAIIRAHVIEGTRGGKAKVREIGDRCQAIETAIAEAEDNDTVFIAGRGHELYQYVAGGVVELDDRVQARAALKARKERQGR